MQNGVNGHTKKPVHSLALDRATLEEVQAQAKLNGSSWRGALNMEAYLRREEYLATQEIAKGSGLTCWVLYDIGQKRKARDVLAGCETLKKRAIVSRNGELRDVIAYGVGSVFTPPAFRGHGYGGIMMQKLSTELENWQTDGVPCLFSVLYSDIGKHGGSKRFRQLFCRMQRFQPWIKQYLERRLTRAKKFYEKNGGWRSFPSGHISLKPYESTLADLQAVEPLYEDDLPRLCVIDEAMIRESMAKRRQGTAVALIPDHKTLEWHHARENFVSNELYGRRPMIKGAITRVGDDRVWGIFTRVWQNENPQQRDGNTLHVLRLVVENRKGEIQANGTGLPDAHIAAVASVFRFAQREAHEWNMEDIELWNPRPVIVEAAKTIDAKVELVERESESICSLRWYGNPDAEVEWLENEKYGWC